MLKGFGSIISDLKGKAQALVGQMLMARSDLNDLAKSSNPAVAARAKALLIDQAALESELAGVNNQLNDPNADLGIGDYASIGVFFVKLKTQVDTVAALKAGAPKSLLGDVSIYNIGIIGGIVGIMGLGYYFLKRRGK